MEVENEIWKNIDWCQNYQVSTLGRVKSLGNDKTRKEKILKPSKHKNGYLQVHIFKKGKTKNMLVHRLVAEAFLSNPLNLPQINHRNEIKSDNRVENLEYCTADYNNKYGTRIERAAKAKTGVYNTKTSKPIICIETGKIYPSAAEVQRQLGFSKCNISQCCNKKYGYKTSGGYHWKFVE